MKKLGLVGVYMKQTAKITESTQKCSLNCPEKRGKNTRTWRSSVSRGNRMLLSWTRENILDLVIWTWSNGAIRSGLGYLGWLEIGDVSSRLGEFSLCSNPRGVPEMKPKISSTKYSQRVKSSLATRNANTAISLTAKSPKGHLDYERLDQFTEQCLCMIDIWWCSVGYLGLLGWKEARHRANRAVGIIDNSNSNTSSSNIRWKCRTLSCTPRHHKPRHDNSTLQQYNMSSRSRHSLDQSINRAVGHTSKTSIHQSINQSEKGASTDLEAGAIHRPQSIFSHSFRYA